MMNAPRSTWGEMNTPLARFTASRKPLMAGSVENFSMVSLAFSTSSLASAVSSANAGIVPAATNRAASTPTTPLIRTHLRLIRPSLSLTW